MANSIENALYIVATPIGNLEDITLRALEILKNVDIVAAEDTRTTSVLFNHYNISTKLISYHKYSENSRVELFLDYLKDGKSIALVSDAGTPLISDPGNILVKNIIDNNIEGDEVGDIFEIISSLKKFLDNTSENDMKNYINHTRNSYSRNIIGLGLEDFYN